MAGCVLGREGAVLLAPSSAVSSSDASVLLSSLCSSLLLSSADSSLLFLLRPAIQSSAAPRDPPERIMRRVAIWACHIREGTGQRRGQRCRRVRCVPAVTVVQRPFGSRVHRRVYCFLSVWSRGTRTSACCRLRFSHCSLVASPPLSCPRPPSWGGCRQCTNSMDADTQRTAGTQREQHTHTSAAVSPRRTDLWKTRSNHRTAYANALARAWNACSLTHVFVHS